MGFGAVAPEIDEPLFHADWEKRALAVTLACGGLGAWSIDESRHARESLPPAQYLSSSYYAIWIAALETLLERHGFVSADERSAGRALGPGATPRRVLNVGAVAGVLARGAPTSRGRAGAPHFSLGDAVRTKGMHPTGHTRLPRYARGKAGVVVASHGAHVFPDSNAHGQGENPDWLHTVRFEARELWGADADSASSVSVDVWESYLEPKP